MLWMKTANSENALEYTSKAIEIPHNLLTPPQSRYEQNNPLRGIINMCGGKPAHMFFETIFFDNKKVYIWKSAKLKGWILMRKCVPHI